MDLELFPLTNERAKVRRAMLHGREHLVAPLVMMVPGVLAGSKGPLLYPPEEVGRDPLAWNHVPLTCGHPVENGMSASGRDPETLEKYGIGLVLRSRTEDGKLKGEGWFDVAKTRQLAPGVLNALERGQRIELSTGLYTDNEPAKAGAVWNGRPYVAIARNYRPDHLAVLESQEGACSLRDGCGVLVNSLGGAAVDEQLMSSWLRIGEELGLEPLTNEQPRCPLTGQWGNKPPRADRKGLDAAARSGSPLSPIEAENATSLAKIKIKPASAEGSVEAAARKHDYLDQLKAKNEGCGCQECQEGKTCNGCSGKLTDDGDAMNRNEAINLLVANCGCSQEQAAMALNEVADGDLAANVQAVKMLTTNKPLRGLFTGGPKAPLSDYFDGPKGLPVSGETATAGGAAAFIKKTAESAPGNIAGQVAGAVTSSTAGGKTVPVPATKTRNADSEDEESDDTDAKKPSNLFKNKVENQQMTFAEMLKHASPEEQAVWNNAVRVEREQRVAIVSQLVANIADEPTRKATFNMLFVKPLDELRTLQLIAAPAGQVNNGVLRPAAAEQDPYAAHFLGAAGGAIVGNAAGIADRDNILPLPTINWQEEANLGGKRRQA